MLKPETFDLIVIGSGPGGYVAAVRAAQLGFKTAVIERHSRLGGVCLNVGCIPSKALLDSSEYYHLAKEHFADHGILTGKIKLDLAVMMSRKESVVADLTGGIQQLLNGNRITIIHGTARLVAADQVEIDLNDSRSKKSNRQQLTAKHILLATGSEPVALPGIDFDGDRIVNSTGALSFDRVPRHLVIVGGGYIGLELGSVWRRLGAEVTVIEMLPKIASGLDGQIGRTLERLLVRQGFVFHTNTRVTQAQIKGNQVKINVEKAGQAETMVGDRLLLAVGRKPLTRHLNLEAVGVKTNPANGQIEVDSQYRTNVSPIRAIGDLIAGPMLAHKASAEGIAAVECMAGLPGEVNYDSIPGIIYTWPEVATIGLTEEQTKQRDIPYCTGIYPFSGAGRARCMGEKDGFVKIIAHARTDRLLGIHIIGPRAADMIAEGGLAVQFNAASEDIARTVHGHPTFSEALQEAAMAIRKCSIYK